MDDLSAAVAISEAALKEGRRRPTTIDQLVREQKKYLQWELRLKEKGVDNEQPVMKTIRNRIHEITKLLHTPPPA